MINAAQVLSRDGGRTAGDFQGEIYALASRKRTEADRARAALTAAVDELYALQSRVWALERDNAYVDAKLERNSGSGGVSGGEVCDDIDGLSSVGLGSSHRLGDHSSTVSAGQSCSRAPTGRQPTTTTRRANGSSQSTHSSSNISSNSVSQRLGSLLADHEGSGGGGSNSLLRGKAASSASTLRRSTATTTPMRNASSSSGYSTGAVTGLPVHAIMQTEAMQAKVVELQCIQDDTSAHVQYGRVLEHLRKRAQQEVLVERRRLREVCEARDAAAARNREAKRQELEAGRLLQAAHIRLATARRKTEAACAKWQIDIQDRERAASKVEAYNAFLQSQIDGAGMVQLHRRSSVQAVAARMKREQEQQEAEAAAAKIGGATESARAREADFDDLCAQLRLAGIVAPPPNHHHHYDGGRHQDGTDGRDMVSTPCSPVVTGVVRSSSPLHLASAASRSPCSSSSSTAGGGALCPSPATTTNTTRRDSITAAGRTHAPADLPLHLKPVDPSTWDADFIIRACAAEEAAVTELMSRIAAREVEVAAYTSDAMEDEEEEEGGAVGIRDCNDDEVHATKAAAGDAGSDAGAVKNRRSSVISTASSSSSSTASRHANHATARPRLEVVLSPSGACVETKHDGFDGNNDDYHRHDEEGASDEEGQGGSLSSLPSSRQWIQHRNEDGNGNGGGGTVDAASPGETKQSSEQTYQSALLLSPGATTSLELVMAGGVLQRAEAQLATAQAELRAASLDYDTHDSTLGPLLLALTTIAAQLGVQHQDVPVGPINAAAGSADMSLHHHQLHHAGHVSVLSNGGLMADAAAVKSLFSSLCAACGDMTKAVAAAGVPITDPHAEAATRAVIDAIQGLDAMPNLRLHAQRSSAGGDFNQHHVHPPAAINAGVPDCVGLHQDADDRTQQHSAIEQLATMRSHADELDGQGGDPAASAANEQAYARDGTENHKHSDHGSLQLHVSNTVDGAVSASDANIIADPFSPHMYGYQKRRGSKADAPAAGSNHAAVSSFENEDEPVHLALHKLSDDASLREYLSTVTVRGDDADGYSGAFGIGGGLALDTSNDQEQAADMGIASPASRDPANVRIGPLVRPSPAPTHLHSASTTGAAVSGAAARRAAAAAAKSIGKQHEKLLEAALHYSVEGGEDPSGLVRRLSMSVPVGVYVEGMPWQGPGSYGNGNGSVAMASLDAYVRPTSAVARRASLGGGGHQRHGSSGTRSSAGYSSPLPSPHQHHHNSSMTSLPQHAHNRLPSITSIDGSVGGEGACSNATAAVVVAGIVAAAKASSSHLREHLNHNGRRASVATVKSTCSAFGTGGSSSHASPKAGAGRAGAGLGCCIGGATRTASDRGLEHRAANTMSTGVVSGHDLRNAVAVEHADEVPVVARSDIKKDAARVTAKSSSVAAGSGWGSGGARWP